MSPERSRNTTRVRAPPPSVFFFCLTFSLAGLFQYLRIPVEDLKSEDLSGFFADAVAFIEMCLEQGTKILVHCREAVACGFDNFREHCNDR